MYSNQEVKVSWISQNGIKMLKIFRNPSLQLSLSQKSRGQFDPLHPSNWGPDTFGIFFGQFQIYCSTLNFAESVKIEGRSG